MLPGGEGEKKSNYMYVAYVVASYWIVSISMVYLNKVLVSNPDSSITAPLFVTWYQCLVTAVVCVILGNLGSQSRSSTQKSWLDEYPVISFDMNTCVSVLPLSLVFVGMIAFNNLCLQLVEVSFYNVARSLAIVFNVIFTFLILGKSTSLLTMGTLLVVIFGFYVGIEGEINFSLYGTLAGVMSSVFVSLNSIFTSKVLAKVNNDRSLLLFYNNLNGVVMFTPLVLYFEWDILINNTDKFFSPLFWFSMTLSGLMGFAMGLVTVNQVKATSPLGHNMSGTAKASFQSLLAFYIWGNQATFQGVAGILLVIFGSGLYTWVQMLK